MVHSNASQPGGIQSIGLDALDFERYGVLLMEDRTIVIYDRTDDDAEAWIKADEAVSLDDRR